MDPQAARRAEGQQAVELAYSETLDSVARQLSSGVQVLIQCEKALVDFLLQAMKNKLSNV